MTTAPLPLTGGHDAGPLFAHGPRRRSARTDNRGPLRRRRVQQRAPGWADAALTRDLYTLVRIYTRATGELHAIDHIVPLHHPLVCGLHTPANLMPSLQADNARKSNCHWPDMPEAQQALPL